MDLWVKAFHIIAMVAWFAGLFYLPRLFVYHADAKAACNQHFKTMEYRLFYFIMTPAAILTILLGLHLLFSYGWRVYHKDLWLHLKLTLIILLVAFHCYCGVLVHKFRNNRNQHSATFFRLFNEIPTLFLIAIVILTIVKPF